MKGKYVCMQVPYSCFTYIHGARHIQSRSHYHCFEST